MKKMNSLCLVSNRVFENKFREHVNDHGDEGIGAHAVLVSDTQVSEICRQIRLTRHFFSCTAHVFHDV